MRTSTAIGLGGGTVMYAASILSELAKVPTWEEFLQPAHVFQLLGALLTIVFALRHGNEPRHTDEHWHEREGEH